MNGVYMRFYDEKAHAIYVELENKMEEIRGAPLEDATVKLLSDAVDHLEKLDAIMTRAQAFAVDAASFVHQRLANVQVTGDGGGPVRIAVDSIAPEDRRRMYYEEMRATS